jgi:hypothetical protein
MKKIEKLKELIASIEADATKFYSNGNSAAGTRVRKAMLDIKNAAQEIRVEVQEVKNKEVAKK